MATGYYFDDNKTLKVVYVPCDCEDNWDISKMKQARFGVTKENKLKEEESPKGVGFEHAELAAARVEACALRGSEMEKYEVTEIINKYGYCSVHKSYRCECYRKEIPQEVSPEEKARLQRVKDFMGETLVMETFEETAGVPEDVFNAVADSEVKETTAAANAIIQGQWKQFMEKYLEEGPAAVVISKEAVAAASEKVVDSILTGHENPEMSNEDTSDHVVELAKSFNPGEEVHQVYKPSKPEGTFEEVFTSLAKGTAEKKVLVSDGYEPLFEVLRDALDQAQFGKGKKCHANNLPFLQQEIIKEGRTLGPMGHVFQVRKKVREAAQCENDDRAIEDLLGAIVYTAALVLLRRER